MKAVHAAPLALLVIAAASAASAQTAPSDAGSDITRMLNGAPPAATRPASAPTSVTLPSTPPPTANLQPAAQPAHARLPLTDAQRPANGTANAAPPISAPASSPVSATNTVAEAAPSPPPPWTILDAPATTALPFRAELPAGFAITEGRPGPDFHVYTIRRGEQPFVMVYVGDYSQFPIYDGQMVQAGGRASIVLTEEGRRVAVEHLFQRQASPSQIHVWLASMDGPDGAVAERIAQSIDVR